jgi:Carboxypeptidase regulatory-like domain/TonB dependent receptor
MAVAPAAEEHESAGFNRGCGMRISHRLLAGLTSVFLLAAAVRAGITGSISGIVTDPSGSVVPKASVTARNGATGLVASVKTDGAGFYNFPDLPVGDYELQVQQPGFKTFDKSGIHIDANSAIRVDVKLEIGEVAEKVTVRSDAVQVETQNTQMGEVISSEKMTAVPLNGRDFTNLLALQPGVVPNAYAAQGVGMRDREVGGGDVNSGNQSINGGREASNGFMVNGANVEEGKDNGTAVIPNLDSIEEFRIITNNFDAEYGNYSGGQVNVITKSGTNAFHGSAFEFLRNTVFDARNFFDTNKTPGQFNQNQFGGTVGGPIKKDKVFFFTDYQGTRRIRGTPNPALVPSLADRPDTPANNGNANVLDLFQALPGPAGTVNSDCSMSPTTCWSAVLSNRLHYPVVTGEPYWTPTCNTTNAADPNGCVFPGAVIPASAITPVALKLLPFIPKPNVSGIPAFNFSSTSFNERLRDDKAGIRVDANTRYGMLSAYYHADDDLLNDPYPNINVTGSTIPGFNALSFARAQVLVLSDTKSFGSTAVNEARFSYLRTGQHLATPQGGTGITLASLGFTEGFNQPGGIGPIAANLEGVPTISFGQLGFTMGVPQDTTRQFNNTFQWQDNYTRIIGRHSLKFGGEFHYDQINDRNFFGEDGAFAFNGDETGVDYLDFLLGAPSNFIQASNQLLDSRSKYFGVYAQDSWRVTPNLTLNYGLRWEFGNPWYDTGNKIETLIPGEQSIVFPAGTCSGCTGAPTGWVFPGDPGVPRTLAPTQYTNFAPRVGLAYSPGFDSGFLAKLTGGPGKMSIRMGFGIYYTAIEDHSQFQEIGDPPYGEFFFDGGFPGFAAPYVVRTTGVPFPAPFPFMFPPPGVSAKNPDPNVDWAAIGALSGVLAYDPHNVTPRVNQYNVSVQRQLGTQTVLSVSYVGNEGHKLISLIEANPGNGTLCVQLNQLGATPACVSGGEGTAYTLPPNTAFPSAATPVVETTGICASGSGTCNVVNTLYTRLGPNFGNVPFEATVAQSSYNSLQVSLRHASGLSNFLLGYTYSRCMDDASALQEGINPFNPRQSLGLCLFDVTHNFVGSYEVRIPFDRMFHATSGFANKIATGWAMSGITTFATGLPVNLMSSSDNSLSGTQGGEDVVDLPNFSGGGPILAQTDPRKAGPYFNTALFSDEPVGQIGDSRRRFFHGPGINNWDIALLKTTRLTESKSLEFRFEAFNIFNHNQFQNPSSNVDSGNFGLVTTANDPRIMQAALKFLF